LRTSSTRRPRQTVTPASASIFSKSCSATEDSKKYSGRPVP